MSEPSRSTSLRRPGLLALVLAVVVSPLTLLAAPAQAAGSTGLVISEVFGANSATVAYNQDYVEIYNPTTSAISLAGKSVQYRAATSGSASSRVDLPAIMLPAGAHFLVGGAVSSNPTTAQTITPDAANTSMNLSGTAGVVVLANSQSNLTLPAETDPTKFPAAVIDLVGYGTTPNLYETSRAPAPTTTGTPPKPVLNRAGNGATDTDNNGNDFTTAATGTPQVCDCIAPTGLKITEVYTDGGKDGSTYDHDFVEIENISGASLPLAGLTLQYRAPGDTGPATVVTNLTGTLATNAYDVAQLAGTDGQGAPVTGIDYTANSLDLARIGGTFLIVKGTNSYDPGTGAAGSQQYLSDVVGWGSSNVYETAAADSTDLDATHSLQRGNGGVDSGDNSQDFGVDTPTPNTQPAIPVKTIPEIQGTGATTQLNGANVAVSGVVTAAYPIATGGFNGFYLQTPGYDAAHDATPDASDGIFVFTGSGTYPTPSVGQYVTLSSARVSEFSGMTELTSTNAANITARAATTAEVVTPGTVVPGTDCTITGSSTDCLTGGALAAAREAHEGELFLPTAPYTVSDSYDGSPWTQATGESFKMKGEIGLAANDSKPLFAPTEVANPGTDPQGIVARNAYNGAHMITLDDGTNVDYASTTSTAFPWLTGPGHTVRIGASVTFAKPVVLDFRNDLWKLQPQSKVGGGTDGIAQGISIEQDRPAAPEAVGGNVRIATFNMLNYFVDDAQTWVSQGGDAYQGADRKCTYYTDRTSISPGNRVTANTCTWTDARGVVPPAVPVQDGGAGPRGAAQKCGCSDLTDVNADFERQQAKEIRAINTMNADVMSLEEVENAIKLGYADRDRAVTHLVDVLNADWNANHPGDTDPTPRWAYAATPRPEAQPTIAEQDAIRSAFIYNPRVVETVGRSEILVNSAPFRNAREPLAQAFKRVGGNRDDGFVVIVNHFKSKGDTSGTASGDNVDLGDGAGSYNGDRIRQAKALDAFAQSVSDDKGIPAVFLTGDYNAYSKEDPVLTLEDAGWHELAPDNHEKSYAFGGLMGSLDHVFANDAAAGMVTGQTVWPINANEPVFYEYSRYNYNLTNLYDGTVPFRASDHNPEVIGVNAPLNPPVADVDTVQVLASNDFHGRILDDPASAAAGAAAMAGAVKGLRADNPDTLFAMAGDIIGASTFESFIAKDKPTLDALNEAGLDVSSAGNHEFDRGYHDLLDRVMKPYDATDNPYGGANWPYLAANVRLKSDDSYALASDRTDHGYDHSDGATWWKQLPDGHTVGFIGAVTEDLPSLVAPSALQDVYVTGIVDEVNAAADRLEAPGGCGSLDGCDVVIELVHEGAATPALSSLTDDSTFARIVNGADGSVDAIVSGHTHLKYNHRLPVQQWIDENRAVTERPVVSAGQYGSYLNQLEFDFEPGTDNLLDIRQHVLAMKDYDPDTATQGIVADAVANADVQGARTIGNEDGPFQRARRQDPATSSVVENRGGESTLGNQVAEIQRWKTGAQIAFMNPGGLRADLMGTGSYPSDITYRQAADVQPFANTLVTLDLTGAQIKTVLEQQWQRDPDGNIPSRPFLRLGTSKGFQFSYDPSRLEGDRITGMWLDGDPIKPATTYHVAATNFLVEGGDNFRGLTAGTHQQDTGFTDLQATVDYLEAHPTVSPDFAQHAVDLAVTSTAPDGGYVAGDTVTLDVASLAMTGDQVQADTQDTTVRVYAGDTPIGPAASVNNSLRSLPDDEAGTAHVTFTVPAGVTGPTTTFVLKGDATGTAFPITVPTRDNRTATTVSAEDTTVAYGEADDLAITVSPSAATGTVTVKDGTTTLGTATLSDGSATYTLAAGSLEPGDHTLTLAYGGDDTHAPSSSTVDMTVEKATPTVDAAASPSTVDPGETSTVQVHVSAAGFTPTGTITCSAPGIADVSVMLDGDGDALCTVGSWATAGDRTVTISYGGDAHAQSGRTTETITVAEIATTVSAADATVTYGEAEDLAITVSPSAATGTVTVKDGSTTLGTATLSDGSATYTLAAGSLEPGHHTLALAYGGDDTYAPSASTVDVTVDKAPSTTAVSVSPSRVKVRKGRVSVTAQVTSPAGVPSGAVELSADGVVVATVPVAADGTATAKVGPFDTVGTHQVTAHYTGDEVTSGSEASADVIVTKATPKMTVDRRPEPVVRNQTRVVLDVRLTDPAQEVTGDVSVTGAPGDAVVESLSEGRATLKLPVFMRTGEVTLEVVYRGSADNERVVGTVSFKVLDHR